MLTTADIVGFDGRDITLRPDDPITRDMLQKQVKCVEIRLVDGREITADQRKKIFATIRDISLWSGHEPEYLRYLFTWYFIAENDGMECFSLSNVDRTTAGMFVDYLVKFCLDHDVPTRESLKDRCDDVYKYLYGCMESRKCAICNQYAEIHHVDRIGMGRDRENIVHVGLNAIALCRKHHILAHVNEQKLFSENHIHGIPLDDYLCKKLNLKTGDE